MGRGRPNGAAPAARLRGDAAGYLDLAESSWRALDAPGEVARVVRYRANQACFRGDWDAAAAYCAAALRLTDEAERRAPGAGQPDHPIHNLLGAIQLERGDYPAARRALLRSLRAARRIAVDRVYWCLAPLLNLGRLHAEEGRRAPAERYYRRCLALTEAGENRGLRAAAQTRLSALLAGGGATERPEAITLARAARDLYAAIGQWGDHRQAVALLDRLVAASERQ
jgi:tetratricopeptide (TPR) repeat protein